MPLVPSGFKIFHRPFGEMEEALQGEEVDGVLMDLGVSNNQAGTARGLDPEAGSRWSINPTSKKDEVSHQSTAESAERRKMTCGFQMTHPWTCVARQTDRPLKVVRTLDGRSSIKLHFQVKCVVLCSYELAALAVQLEVPISGLNPSHGVPAADWLQEVSVEELGLSVCEVCENFDAAFVAGIGLGDLHLW